MREIALREASSMITNTDRDGITDMFADQRHVASTMDERIVQQVA
jgi:hypothetical protein